MIHITDLHKTLGERDVLKGMTLQVKKSETLVILGPSGCGKSVLLKHICGLMKADSGQIVVAGLDMNTAKKHEILEIRKKIGFVFQNAALFDSLTVYENMAFPLRRHSDYSENKIENEVENTLNMVGLPGISGKMPSDLSGGMRKRVGLARALMLHPEIMLYDEPTTGLDPIMTTVIDELIMKLSKKHNMTTVIVTHDLKSARRTADRCAMHHNGKIIEISQVEKFFRSENRIVRNFIEGRIEMEDGVV